VYFHRSLTLELHNITRGNEILMRRDAKLRTLSVKGTFATDYDISTQKNAQHDGVTVTNTSLGARMIPITFEFRYYKDAVKLREELIHFFSPRFEYELTITRDDIKRKIGCIMWHIDDDAIENVHDYYQFGMELMCPDPCFEDIQYTTVNFLTFAPMMSYPLAFPPAGMTTGVPLILDDFNVNNPGDTPVGVVIDIDVHGGDMVNPKITRVHKDTVDEFVSLPREFTSGTKIRIDTNFKRENVYINGVSDFRVQWQSDFFLLYPGDNKLLLAADEGVGNARTSVKFKNKWFGV